MFYVKAEIGLFTADPKKDPTATHIPRISVQELLARDLNDLVVERAVLHLMLNARHVTEIQFVNGLKPGQLTAALDGEPVGTVIYRERRGGGLGSEIPDPRDFRTESPTPPGDQA